jgi:hypothetical protein
MYLFIYLYTKILLPYFIDRLFILYQKYVPLYLVLSTIFHSSKSTHCTQI